MDEAAFRETFRRFAHAHVDACRSRSELLVDRRLTEAEVVEIGLELLRTDYQELLDFSVA